jgi:hypothetical protein
MIRVKPSDIVVTTIVTLATLELTAVVLMAIGLTLRTWW